jgi:allantoicase
MPLLQFSAKRKKMQPKREAKNEGKKEKKGRTHTGWEERKRRMMMRDETRGEIRRDCERRKEKKRSGLRRK